MGEGQIIGHWDFYLEVLQFVAVEVGSMFHKHILFASNFVHHFL